MPQVFPWLFLFGSLLFNLWICKLGRRYMLTLLREKRGQKTKTVPVSTWNSGAILTLSQLLHIFHGYIKKRVVVFCVWRKSNPPTLSVLACIPLYGEKWCSGMLISKNEIRLAQNVLLSRSRSNSNVIIYYLEKWVDFIVLPQLEEKSSSKFVLTENGFLKKSLLHFKIYITRKWIFIPWTIYLGCAC